MHIMSNVAGRNNTSMVNITETNSSTSAEVTITFYHVFQASIQILYNMAVTIAKTKYFCIILQSSS